MASVQAAPMAQAMGTTLPGLMTQQQAQELFAKYRQLQDQGVPPTDPEFIKTAAQLKTFQMKVKQSQLQKQSQQQAMQAAQAAANGSVNGVHHARQPSAQPQSAGTPGVAVASAPGSGGSMPSPSAPAHFSQMQLNLLRQQIQAFKTLSKNAGVSQQIQQVIFSQRKRRQPSTASQPPQQTPQPAGPSADRTPDAAKRATAAATAAAPQESAAGPAQKNRFKGVKNPYESHMQATLPYHDHRLRKNRNIIPSIFPTGVDFEQLRHEREVIVFNRMKARYAELRSLPANIAQVDAKDDLLVADDSIKRQALIEMKSLALYARQRALREKVGRVMMSYDNLAMTTNRSMYRRQKKQSVREARITEKLENQQRAMRENREKKKHSDYLRAVLSHRDDLFNLARDTQARGQKMGRFVASFHYMAEKEEQKRIERTAKQRLQALKADDEEAYLQLLDQAKDTRITHLLKQTDGFLHQLAASVKVQQRQAAERYGGENDLPESEDDSEEDNEAGRGRKIDYYAVAHRIREEVTEQASILVGGTLKEYQLKGLQWMISLYNNNLNGILADEMGLGKTIQTISLITYLIERKLQNGPYLVIVPLSTLTNWTLEFEKWAPSVTKIVYKGPPNARKQQQEKIRQGRFQVLLTTYEYIIKDRPILSKIKWFHMIIDEGHRMKNANSKLSGTISQYYSTRFRVILTGTPLQNNLGELWAMLNFVLPNIFKSAVTFDEWFNTPFANTGGQDKMELNEEEQILVIRRLHKVLRPFLLRRLKKDVEKDLPDKTEKVIKCKFSALQARLYKQMVTHNKFAVSAPGGGKTGARGLSNMIMQLRKLCNHPFVFEEVEDQMNPDGELVTDMIWRSSGKFELLDRILPKYKATGHRVLMFFQMTAIMDIMCDFLTFRGYQFMRLDGTTKSEERSDLLKQFNAPDSPYFIFLLSTRAGGLGLNLQTADTVIIYDSDWNPFQDLQAQDRAHRIGQKNEVRIVRLISSNSVEEKILERARYKLDMDGKVIQAGRFDNKSSETDRDAMLRTLLESADLAESGEQDEMDDEELNMILARSEEELQVFSQLDEDRAKDPIYGSAPGAKGVPRLMQENELPDIYLNEGNPEAEEEERIMGRGARERVKVRYDDGLTEEQWALAVDDDEDSPEAAAMRKLDKKERREQNRLKKLAMQQSATVASEAGSRVTSEEPETPKKRGRKPGSKNEKRKAEDGDDEPPQKKRRGPQGRPKAVHVPSDASSNPAAAKRALLTASLQRIIETMGEMDADIEDLDPEAKKEDDDQVPQKRHLLGPFMKLVHKRQFPDYYAIIQEPISIREIETKIKKGMYSCISDMGKDIELMFRNCRMYNEDGSILYKDADILEDCYKRKAAAELIEHPELAALEPGSKDTSADPTTGPSSPALPASSGGGGGGGPRIKLIMTNGNRDAANGKSKSPENDDES